MLFVQAIVEAVICVLIIFLFKSMHINKYGVASTNRDDLSDVGKSTKHSEENY